ncbi:helix-turn-helix domain-containing protein [Methylocystis sp. IM4]|uniref:helix-turn-helix domain-containing protein n=1 Tax=Methylocystis sp. IM4 TaxID=3136560 RepID=UPI00311A773C
MVKEKSEAADEGRDELLVAIGERIRTLRVSHGWTQRKLAEMIGMTSANIYIMEKGAQNSSILALKKVASGLGVSMAALLPEAEQGVESADVVVGNWLERSEDLLEGLRSRRVSINNSIEELEKFFAVYLELIRQTHSSRK